MTESNLDALTDLLSHCQTGNNYYLRVKNASDPANYFAKVMNYDDIIVPVIFETNSVPKRNKNYDLDFRSNNKSYSCYYKNVDLTSMYILEHAIKNVNTYPCVCPIISGKTSGQQDPLLMNHNNSNNNENPPDNSVVNLSSIQLTPAMNSLLSKGLNFCPTPGEPNVHDLRVDLDRFHVSLRRK
jgi:hypothetical protein